MKTNYLFTLLTVLLFLSCGTKDSAKKATENTVKRPTQALTYNELVPMLKYYDAKKRDTLRRTTLDGGNDTRVNFYKLEDLKAYIAYVEYLAQKKDIEITGINIISAAYPQDVKYGKKQGYQTLIFMPATTIGNKENVSFDPLYSDVKKPKMFAEILYSKFNYSFRGYPLNKQRSVMKKTTVMQGPGELDSSGANRTHISPPY